MDTITHVIFTRQQVDKHPVTLLAGVAADLPCPGI
jgi:hypothetical protein